MDIILRSSHRYLISGVVFTIFGPTLFWLLYPLGAMLGLAVSITVAHAARYFVFRVFVFTRNQGYRVSPIRYLMSICPAVLAEFFVTSMTYRFFSRTVVVALATGVSICIGYLSSKYIFSRPDSQLNVKGLGLRK
ncbi:GtrA-like protein [Prochlorococcus marinus str. MIT 1313]|nr:GtrA-like protein [Prochlorococcus marinus str. MIT 1313]